MESKGQGKLNSTLASSDSSINTSMESASSAGSSAEAPAAPDLEKGPFSQFSKKTVLFEEVFYKSDQIQKIVEIEKETGRKNVQPEEGMFHVFSSLGRPFLLLLFEYCFVFLIGFFTGMGLSLIIITNLFGFNFNRCRYGGVGGGTGGVGQVSHLDQLGGAAIKSDQAKAAVEAAGIKPNQHSRIVLSQFICPKCPGNNKTTTSNVSSIASYVYYEPVDSESNYKCLAIVFIIMISILCLFVLFGMFKLFRLWYHKHVDKMHKLIRVEKKEANQVDQEPEKSYSYSVSRKSLSGVET